MIRNVRTFAAILIVLMSISVLGSGDGFLETVQELHEKVCEAIRTLGAPATLPKHVTNTVEALAFMSRANIAGRKVALGLEQSAAGQEHLAPISGLLAEIERLQTRALDTMPQ